MTYDEIKRQYPLGCEVKTKPIRSWKNEYEPMKGLYLGTPLKHKECQGKILAVLDPDKHGDRCLLFKIEKPEGRKISRESAEATVKRKLDFHWGRNWGPEIFWDTPTEEAEILIELCPPIFHEEYGTLKWLKPSEIKERVDKEEPIKMPNMATDEEGNMYHWASQLHRSEPMDRTEEIRKKITNGTKVKLKNDVEDWPENNSPKYHPEMAQDLGSWIEVGCYVSQDRFVGKGNSKGGWFWPLTMIEKVEGEEEARYCNKPPEFGDRIRDKKDLGGVLVQINDHEPKYRCKMDNGRYHTIPSERIRREGPFEHPQGLPRLEDRYSTKDPATIPVEREKVKEKLKEANSRSIKERDVMRALLRETIRDEDLIMALDKEIEEEEKYPELYGKIEDWPDKNLVAVTVDDFLSVKEGYTPEIHHEDGKYRIYFKRK